MALRFFHNHLRDATENAGVSSVKIGDYEYVTDVHLRDVRAVTPSRARVLIGCPEGGELWFPVKDYLFALVNPVWAYAGLVKILILFLIVYFGGIGFPLIFMVLAAGFILSAVDK